MSNAERGVASQDLSTIPHLTTVMEYGTWTRIHRLMGDIESISSVRGQRLKSWDHANKLIQRSDGSVPLQVQVDSFESLRGREVWISTANEGFSYQAEITQDFDPTRKRMPSTRPRVDIRIFKEPRSNS